MKNKYATTCESCHRHVPAGEGSVYKPANRWLTYHRTCDPLAPAPTLQPDAAVTAVLLGEQEGWLRRTAA